MTANGAQSPMERVYESLLMHEFHFKFNTHTTMNAHTHTVFAKKEQGAIYSLIFFNSVSLAHALQFIFYFIFLFVCTRYGEEVIFIIQRQKTQD